MTSTTSKSKSYFDIHTSGIGYIRHVRQVPVNGGRKAMSFLACTVAALVGPATKPTRRYFDVRVSGAEAKQLVQPYIGIDDPQQRLLVRFRLGDLWIDPFRRLSGDPAASIKARLLKAELLEHSALEEIENHELHTCGIGYLNNPRMIANGGDPFLSCSIAALAGPVGDPEYRYIEATVADDSAQHLVQRCVQAVEAKKKVMLAFTLNDMKAEAYIRIKGERAGEVGGSLKSKLVRISLIKVDGEKVYPLELEAPVSEDVNVSKKTALGEDDSGGSQPTAAIPTSVENRARMASF